MDLVAAEDVEPDDAQLRTVEQQVGRPAEPDPVQPDGQAEQGICTNVGHS